MKGNTPATRAWNVPLPLLLAVAGVATAVVYLGYTAGLRTSIGFPLDDSWIHQTFARHLARAHSFYFNPGEPSTASTAPLWTILLAAGYWLPLDFRLWSYALGLLFLALAAWATYRLSRRLFPERRGLALAAAVGVSLEWHLAWASLSGMETTLFTFLSVLLLWLALEEKVSALLLGTAGGLATLARPEGAALFGLALLARLGWTLRTSQEAPWLRSLARWISFAAPASATFLFVLAPYLSFNYAVTGQPLPSTFYAKHAAYAGALKPAAVASYWARAAQELLTGPLLLLAPGPICGAASALAVARKRKQSRRPGQALLPFLWLIALPVLYTLRLPATYHHGRYLVPLIPILVVYSLWGTGEIVRALPLRLLGRVYAGLIVVFWLVQWGNGAVVYGWDVRFINEQEVAVARWLRDFTPIDSLVATHDVGAIGYFSERRIVDTAGLVTPELAPYVRDEGRILSYLEKQQVDYLAVFPRWYPHIVADPRLEEVYRLRYAYAIEQGADNMVVLRAHWRK